ncbi:NUP188 [Mytilus edulis]|uniref:NUP188 n=1 Tax=Mytilus edulis TaxID=6550 RepID=A0A8S3Q6G7_MYTED|nr:NUP188 [Mytilus edulis]
MGIINSGQELELYKKSILKTLHKKTTEVVKDVKLTDAIFEQSDKLLSLILDCTGYQVIPPSRQEEFEAIVEENYKNRTEQMAGQLKSERTVAGDVLKEKKLSKVHHDFLIKLSSFLIDEQLKWVLDENLPTWETHSVLMKVDKIVTSMGSEPCHGPILLCWATIRLLYGDKSDLNITRKLGNLAIQLRVFDVLFNLLNTEPFNGKTTIYETWKNLLRYTEPLDRNYAADLMATKDPAIWKLARNKFPFSGSNVPLSLVTKVTLITQFVKAMVSSYPAVIDELTPITECLYQVIHSGQEVSAGSYGQLLAGTELIQGHYPVTCSLLDLMSNLIQVSRMSILACLGGEAEAIRDMYLTRLQAVTEDLSLGKTSCLLTVHNLMEAKKQMK